jgi:hypothetical protein
MSVPNGGSFNAAIFPTAVLMRRASSSARVFVLIDATGSFSKPANPLFLKEYVIAYNWDDGFDVPNAIADNEYYDLGTALILFLLAEGMSFYKGEIAIPKKVNSPG